MVPPWLNEYMNSRSLIEAKAPLLNCSCARHSPIRSPAAGSAAAAALPSDAVCCCAACDCWRWPQAASPHRASASSESCEVVRMASPPEEGSCRNLPRAGVRARRGDPSLARTAHHSLGTGGYFRLRTHFTNACKSASGTWGLGVIGTCPHTPAPPFRTFSASLASTSCPLYFAATSLNAGPTTLWSTAWHAVQPYLPIMSSGLTEALAVAWPPPDESAALACSVPEGEAFSSAAAPVGGLGAGGVAVAFPPGSQLVVGTTDGVVCDLMYATSVHTPSVPITPP